ncbi:MAG: hypothetical protein ABIQ17_06910 [Candidatus Limnocylindrales bacterium]
MSSRYLATVAAITSLLFGGVGLVLPEAFGRASGIEFDATATALVRLACASYVGFAVLAWLARDLTDPMAWRAVAGANAVSWAVSAVVIALALVSGLGTAVSWALVAMQVGFGVVWSVAYIQARPAVPPAA